MLPPCSPSRGCARPHPPAGVPLEHTGGAALERLARERGERAARPGPHSSAWAPGPCPRPPEVPQSVRPALPTCVSPQSNPQHSGNFQCPPLINGRVGAVSSGSSWINRPGPDRPEEGREEVGGGARKPGRGRSGKTRCRARGICRVRVQGPPGQVPQGAGNSFLAPPCPAQASGRAGGGAPALTFPSWALWPPACPLRQIPPAVAHTVQPPNSHWVLASQTPWGVLVTAPLQRMSKLRTPGGIHAPRGPGWGAPGQAPSAPGGCGLSPPANWPLSLQDTRRLTPPWVMLPGPPGGHSSAGAPPAHLPPLAPYRSFQNLLPKSSLQEACRGSASEEPRLGGADPDCSGPPLPSLWGAGAGGLPSCRGAHRWHHQAGTPGVGASNPTRVCKPRPP